MTTTKKIIITVLFLVLAVVLVQFFIDQNKDPNDLNRTYTIKDFPSADQDETSDRLIQSINNSIAFLKTNPNHDVYTSWINIGNTKRALRDYNGSKAAYFKAIEIDDKNPLAYLNLGTLYKLNIGDYEKAEQYYLEAHHRINVPYFSDYESFADLYVNFWPEAGVDVEKLMLDGANRVQGKDKLPYYEYIYNYYKDSVPNTEKVDEYLKLMSDIDPNFDPN